MIGIQLTDYDVNIDVKRDGDGHIASGLVLGDILAQNQALILSMHTGDLKSDVSVGVGIDRMLLDNDRLGWEREIQEQLELDGQMVEAVEVTNREIKIKAQYI